MQQKNVLEILTFLERSKRLESVERYGASLLGMKNSVAEHSWRLALMALVIAKTCNITVDMYKTLSLALMHDLAEGVTGDIDAYKQIRGGASMLAQKAVDESRAMESITHDLSFGSWVYELWEQYEAQQSLEAKFVKALDKIEGFLHISEVGVDLYIPKEFHADYADAAVKAFDHATHHFPGLKELLDAVKLKLQREFEKAGVAWVE